MSITELKPRLTTDMKVSRHEDRKCLGVLNANRQSRLIDENCGPAKLKRKDGIYEDPESLVKKQKTFVSVCVQTDQVLDPTTNVSQASDKSKEASPTGVDKTINMLTSDTAPPEYWEALAEKRRAALEESLIENQSLHEENKTLKHEVQQLKQENRLLEEVAGEAKHLALLVESLTDEQESDTNTDEVAV
ncbi:geminin-like [Homarus americanus]|uniref:Geminin-like n=1 Tax=Homarus americanus TaxID=6706 RepID=A0A8J5N636_HOMAM|nr:geminin-like [Homarus americanus]